MYHLEVFGAEKSFSQQSFVYNFAKFRESRLEVEKDAHIGNNVIDVLTVFER